MRKGRDVSATRYIEVLRMRSRATHAFLDALDGADALLTPTTTVPAIPLSDVDENVAASHFTRAGNFLDLCGLAVPNGTTATGLPLSLLINSRAFDESRVLRIGWAYEQATPELRRIPAGLD